LPGTHRVLSIFNQKTFLNAASAENGEAAELPWWWLKFGCANGGFTPFLCSISVLFVFPGKNYFCI